MALSAHPASLAALVVAVGAWGLVIGVTDMSIRPRWAIAAILVTALALTGPVDRIAESGSLTVHMLQVMLLLSVVPVLALRGTVLAPRAVAVSANGAGWLMVAGTALVWASFLPVVMDARLALPALNDLAHLGLLLAGGLLAWPLMAPRPLSGMAAVAYLVVAELAIGVLGMWLTWYPEVVYAAVGPSSAPWELSAATDQSLAGAVLLVVEEPFLAVEVAVLFIAALRDSE